MNDQPKIITLTQGHEAIVDAEDYGELNKNKWFYNCGYARRNVRMANGKQTAIRMHREINQTPDGLVTDHINHNMLDNRKENLRTTTHQQNCMNGDPHKDGTSKYRGVNWDVREKKWMARIMIDGKQKYLGRFIKEEDAAKAYNEAATKLFGVYARLNSV